MRFHWYWMGALALSAAGIGACSSDSAGNPGIASDDGGSDATATDDGSPASEAGPEGGFDAGSTDAKADSSAAADAGDAGKDAAVAPSAYALFVGTDFSNGELSVVGLNPDGVAGHLALQDQDSIPYGSGGLGFVLEQQIGDVLSLDPAQPWTARATIDVNDGPDAGLLASNPHAVVVTTGTKAYVARYASNVLDVIDAASGATTGSIDLSAFLAPDDTDGLVDVTDGVYDPSSSRAYLLLQRINQFDYSGAGPDYVNLCLASHGEIVAVDVTTDTVIHLTDASATGALDLLGDNPASITADLADGKLLIPDVGCYAYPDGGVDAGDTVRLGRGIESLDLTTGTSTWLYQTTDLQRLSGLIWIDGTHAYVNEGSDWYAWNPTQTTLGAVESTFPQAPVYDGAGRIIGLTYSEADAGTDAGAITWSVVAWAVANGQVSTIAASPFQSVVPATAYGVTSALLR